MHSEYRLWLLAPGPGTSAPSAGIRFFGNHLAEEELKPVFEAGLKNGLTLWDTAVVYGMDASEAVLAAFVKTHPREEVMLSPKFTPQIEELIRAMKKIGEEYGATVSQVAIAWAIAKGTIPIIGVTKPSHVEDAAKAARLVLKLEQMAELERVAAKAGVDTKAAWENAMAAEKPWYEK